MWEPAADRAAPDSGDPSAVWQPLRILLPQPGLAIPGGSVMASSSGDPEHGSERGERGERQPRPASPRPGRHVERQVSYEPEERYWTDYLRIALPVLGLLLLIGLLWYWASALIGGGTADQPSATVQAVAGITPVNPATPPPAPTPTPAAAAVVATQPPAPTAVVAVAAQPTPPPAVAAVEPTVPPPADAAATVPPATTDQAANDNPCANLPTYEVGTIVQTTEQVNLREGPSTDSNPIQVLPQGTRLQITGQYSEEGQCDWWPVTTVDTGQSGYVIEQYLTLSQQ